MVHELGHFCTAYLFKWNIDKIKFYPYGGTSSFIEDINRPLKEELWILCMGPITQIAFYCLLKLCPFSIQTINFITTYHYTILIFNLLPIYPLDGGKLVQIFLSYFIAYKKSLTLTLYISFIILFIIFSLLFLKYYSLNFICLFILLLTKLLKEKNKEEYYYQKFLLERYLNQYNWKKTKIIKEIKDMMRDKKHFIKIQDHYYTEKEILKKKYKKR